MGFADSNLCPAKTKNTVGCLFEENMCIYNEAKSVVGHNSQFFGALDPNKKDVCMYVKWKKKKTEPGLMTQIRFGFPARRNSSGGSKERCSFFCECMSESAAPDDDTVRTSSSFFLLHTPGATQQVRNKPEEIFPLLV